MNSLLSKRLSFTQDFIITLFNVFSVIISTLLVNAIISRKFGLQFVGEYNLIKRVALSAVPFIFFGASIVIPKLLGEISEIRYRPFLRQIAIFILLIPVPLYFLTIFLIPSDKTGWLPLYIPKELFGIFVLALAAYLMFQIFYSIFRGMRYFVGAAILSLTINAMIPLVVFIFSIKGFYWSYWFISITMLIFSIVFSMPFLTAKVPDTSVSEQPSLLWPLMNQSAQRAPGMLFQFIIISAPILLISKFGTAEELTFITVGITISRLLLSLVTPIGFVFLPRISAQKGVADQKDIHNKLTVISQLFIIMLGILVPALYLNSPWLMKLWIHLTSTEGIRIINVFILAIPGIVLYELYRIPIDGLFDKGINSLILIIGIIIFGFTGILLKEYSYILSTSIGFLLAYLVMTMVALYYLNTLQIQPIFNKNTLTLISIILIHSIGFMLINNWSQSIFFRNFIYAVQCTALLIITYYWKNLEINQILVAKYRIRQK